MKEFKLSFPGQDKS